ncbi:MAG: hypothetical protein EZS28_015302, partial [Streblomastix strix]
ERLGSESGTSNRAHISPTWRMEQGRKLLAEFLIKVSMTRETQQMIIDGQKYNAQRKYMQTMGVFEDWMKEKNYTIQDIMNQKIPFIHTEFMTQLTRTRKTKPSSAMHHASILNAMLSLIFGTVLVSVTAQRLTTHAISNYQIYNPRYRSPWDINLHYEYWRERPESKLLSDEVQQAMLALLLMSLCFVRIKDIANIDLPISIVDEEDHTAANTPNRVQRTSCTYSGPRTGSKADHRYISTRLERLIQTLGVKSATANSIRHASSTELAAQGFDGRTINCFTHHIPDSQINSYYYIFTVSREQDSIASALVINPGEMQATQIISKQRGGARVSEGDRLRQSPLGDDLQLSTQDTLASPLSLPFISTQPIDETQSPKDHESAKAQNSQMQKDDQDVKPQEEAQNSTMTKDSDRATIAEALK